MNNANTNSTTKASDFQSDDEVLSCSNDENGYTSTDAEMAEICAPVNEIPAETPHNEPPPGKNPDDEYHAQIAAIIDEARKRIDDLPKSDCRGLPKDFLRRWEIGYLPDFQHPKAPSTRRTARFIFRLGDNSDPPSLNAVLTSLAREFFKLNGKNFGKAADKCLSAGKKLLFNPAALTGELAVVTEGEFDALSVMFATDERIKACALGGAGIFGDLIRRLKSNEQRPRLVILFDKDGAGQKHATELLKKLSEIDVVAVVKFVDDFMTDDEIAAVDKKVDANAILQKCGKQVLSNLTDKIIAAARADFPAVEDAIREQRAFLKIEQRRDKKQHHGEFSDEILELRDRINTEITDVDLVSKGYLKHSERGAKAPDGYCCPWCGSGTGEHKTGALKYFTDKGDPHFGCAKCGAGGDVITLVAHVDNLPTSGKGFFDTLKIIADEFNINHDPKIFEPPRRCNRGIFTGSDEEIIAKIRDACEWRYSKDSDGKTKRLFIKPTQANLDLIFDNDPNLRGLVGKDQFQGVNVFLRRAPWHNDDRTGKQWNNNSDDAQIRVYLRRTYSDLDGKQRIEDTVKDFAEKNAFHAVKKFLSNMPKWDGEKRAEEIFIKFLHAEDSAYTRAVTMNFLIGALARVYHPGCDFQTCVVLNGAQRIGKSKLIKMLAGGEGVNPDGENWHVALKDSVDDSHAIDALQRGWFVEIEEFSAARKAEINALKSFISANADTRRWAYARDASTRDRHIVFVATCNDDSPLRDQTGNARFLVIECSKKKFDRVPGMTPEYIRQVWAEALVKYHELFKDGFDDAKLQLPLDIQVQAESITEKFTQDDGLKTEIQGYLDQKIPPQVVWKLLTRERRRHFIREGKITVADKELETERTARGGRESDIARDKCEIYEYLNSNVVMREDISRGNGAAPDFRYILFGNEYRQHICAAEIFTECFGSDKRKSMSRINEILSQLEGWTLGERPIRDDPNYPNQRKPYFRDVLPVDEPPTDKTQPEPPKDDLDGECVLEDPPF